MSITFAFVCALFHCSDCGRQTRNWQIIEIPIPQHKRHTHIDVVDYFDVRKQLCDCAKRKITKTKNKITKSKTELARLLCVPLAVCRKYCVRVYKIQHHHTIRVEWSRVSGCIFWNSIVNQNTIDCVWLAVTASSAYLCVCKIAATFY